MVHNTLKTTRKKGLFLISLLGLAYILFIWINATKTQNEEATHLAKTIAATLDINDIKKFDANIHNLQNTEYKEYAKIKSILSSTTEINRNTDFAFFNARFSYLYTLKDGKTCLLSDSEQPNSEFYSAPGTISSTSNKVYIDIFSTQKSIVTFTNSAEWGDWITVLVPIIDPKSHQTIAALGMDFERFKWFKPIIFDSLEALLIVLGIIAIFLSIIKNKQKNILLIQQIEEIKNSDKKLKENETKLTETLKNSQDIFYKTALDGTILEVSESVHLFSGFVNKDLIGINVTDLYYDATDREKLMGILLKKGKVRDYEIKMRHNQTIRYFLLNCTIVLDENKNPLHIEGAMKDVTERRVAKEKLIESETFLKAIINHQSECIKIVDSKGRLIMMNPSGLKMIEADFFEQVEGHNVIDLIDPKDQVNFQNMHKKVLSGETVKLEFDINGLKGTKRHMETFSVPMEYKGQIVLLAHTRDITERKKSEILLKENEQFLNETQQIGHIGSYNFNIQNNSWKSSEVLNEIFGIDGDLKKTAETWTNLIHPEWRETMSNYLLNEVIGQKKNFEKEYKIIRQNDGAIRWVHGRGKVHFDINGNPINLIGVIQDITNQKEAEEELTKAKEKAEESERLKSAFLANMSHEIRTPMNGILGFTELLKDPNLSGQEQTEYINIIRKSGDRMLNIINDIIDISKIESGLMKVNFGETNVNDHIQYMHAFFKHEAFNQGIELKYDNELRFEEAFINTDKEKIINILTNLIKNAIKFTPKGNIDFGYRLKTTNNPEEKGSDKVLEFYVKDSGIGIDETQQDLVFERFRQTNESTSKNYEGAGLGLAITKSFVEMLGGTIWVESELGKGSTFYFTLPYNPKPKSVKISETINSIKDSESTSDLKILIVEDDEISGKLLEIAVKNIGKSILRARNGIEAVDLAKNNPDIDLILMDIQMPKMDGHQATTEIRKFNKDVIILAQTAFAYSEDIEKAVDAGCNGHISKPVKKVELIKMVDVYFKEKVTINK